MVSKISARPTGCVDTDEPRAGASAARLSASSANGTPSVSTLSAYLIVVISRGLVREKGGSSNGELATYLPLLAKFLLPDVDDDVYYYNC